MAIFLKWQQYASICKLLIFLRRHEINYIPLSRNLKLQIIIDDLHQQYQIMKFEKLQENLFCWLAQLQMELVLDILVYFEAA